MRELNCNRTLSNRGGGPLYRTMPYIPSYENPRHAALQQVRRALLLPNRGKLPWNLLLRTGQIRTDQVGSSQIRSGEDESLLVPKDRVGQPLRSRHRSDKYEQRCGLAAVLTLGPASPQRLQVIFALDRQHLRVGLYHNIGCA